MIKLKQRFIIYASVLILLLAGCTHDGFFGNRPGAEDESLTFTFRIDGITTNSATRAAVSPIEGETSVQSLHLLFFEASDNENFKLVDVVSLPGGEGESGKLTMETSYLLPNEGNGLDANRAYHIIGIGNLDVYVNNAKEWLAKWKGLTEEYFRDNATVDISVLDKKDTFSINITELLMNGYVEKPAGTKSIQMVLTRNVARFDVGNGAETHTLKTVSVWNAFTQSSITGDAQFDYTSEVTHTKRFYGIKCPATPGNLIVGGLYAFANFSETPGVNDKLTTCLILGLAPSSGGATRYYRVNINTAGSLQHLKNNYAYNIKVLSVTGEGYPSENEAWEGTSNQLVYVVNNWDLDDNGLIVSDEHSILAVPVKTVKIGSIGGEFSYSITTFSTLENPEPLRIKSQLYEPADGNITARISNGNLVIDAGSMNTGEKKRSGIITVTFAGLEATVNVLQTAAGDVYLEVTLDDEWKDFLPPTANTMSEYIYVKASGPWTAQLQGSKNFAFQNSLGISTRKISSSDFTNNKFHIYTSSSNESKTETEKGFVLISLDSDPTNYIAVVTVNQASKGGIDIKPVNLEKIVFYGSGRLQTVDGNLEVDEKSNRFTFQVSSLGSITPNNVRLTGADFDKFSFSFDPSNNFITVRAKGNNTTNDSYTAAITVADNKNGNLMVTLVQNPLNFKFTPPTENVKVTGGKPVIGISIDEPDIKWKAEVTMISDESRPIFGHKIILKKADGGVLEEGEYTNQKLIVDFPKVYYPNRDADIKVIVKVTTSNGLTEKCEIHQDKLTAKKLMIWSRRTNRINYTFGSLGNMEYFDGFINRLNAKIPKGLNDVLTMGTGTSSRVFPTSVHVWLQMSNSNTGDADYDDCWSKVNEWYNNTDNDGIAVFMMGDQNNDFSRSSAYNKGYTYGGSDNSAGSVCLNNDANVISTRIYDFIIIKGKLPIASSSQLTFYNDAHDIYLSTVPTGAVPILKYYRSDGSIRYNMVIDPKNKLVFMGDETIFAESTHTYLKTHAGGYANFADRSAFINNLIDYMLLAAQYGSHFTDMLIDYKDNAPDYVPEPWNKVWGDNAWPN